MGMWNYHYYYITVPVTVDCEICELLYILLQCKYDRILDLTAELKILPLD